MTAGWQAAVSEATSRLLPPPADLVQRELPLLSLDDVGRRWLRCHKVVPGRSPVAYNFALVSGRFNAPNGEFGVVYLGADDHCAFIEAFGPSMKNGDLGLRLVSARDLAQRCLCPMAIAETHRLRLVNLADGHGFGRLGIDGRICTTKDRATTRQWALALWRHPQAPDGLYYLACNDLSRHSLVLFDRAGDVLRASCEQNVLRDSVRLGTILDFYNVGLDPDR